MHNPAPHRFYRFGPNTLDCLRGVLWQDGAQIPLTPRVFDILRTLVQRQGDLVTKDDFMELVWGGVAVEDNNLARQISTLRKLLHEKPGQREYITTVTGVGYRFVGSVSSSDELPEDLRPIANHTHAAPAVAPAPETHPGTSARPGAATGVLAPAGPDAATGPSHAPPSGTLLRPAVRPSRRWAALVFGAVAVAVILGFFLAPREETSAAPVNRSLSQFTHDSGSQSEPAWSPDGTRLALTSDRNGNADIWVHGVTDSAAIQLTASNANDWQPHWSPDGQSIVYRSERGGGGVYIVPARGGPERRVADFGSRPRWSPSGDVILFAQNAPDSTRAIKLFLVAATGGDVHPFTHPEFTGLQISSAGWAPDGRVSVWARDSDGVRYFVTVPRDQGRVTRSATTRFTLPSSSDTVLTSFTWAPSGRFLYFEGRTRSVWNLWRVPTDEHTLDWIGAPERLTLGPGADIGPSVSPDGERLAFGVSTARPGIWSFGFTPATGEIVADGHQVISGMSGERGADATSDGSRVAYRLERNDRQEIWSRTGEGSPELLLSESGASVSAPRWSPDQSRLAYQRSPRASAGQAAGRRSVEILSVDTATPASTTLIALVEGQEVIPTDWAADGRSILATCRLAPSDSLGTCRVALDGERAGIGPEPKWLAGDPRVAMFQQRYSPNQRWISFVAVPRADRSTTTLYVMPAAGGPWRALTNGHSYEDKSRWSPDGRVLYFISNRGGRFEVWGRRFDPEAGTPEGVPFRVTAFEDARQALSPYLTDMEMFITPDRIFLPMFEASSRIWMLDQADQ